MEETVNVDSYEVNTREERELFILNGILQMQSYK